MGGNGSNAVRVEPMTPLGRHMSELNQIKRDSRVSSQADILNL
jgi:hypothetical protein